MHRYILFVGDKKKPAGGYDDYVGSRSTVDAIKKLALSCEVGGYKKMPAWGHIVDVTSMSRLWILKCGEWRQDEDRPL